MKPTPIYANYARTDRFAQQKRPTKNQRQGNAKQKNAKNAARNVTRNKKRNRTTPDH
jgi:hypothetical protein